MSFNTVILYDTENLIGGYAKCNMLYNLSIKDILDKINKKNIGKVAIHRAYANWSDSRLNVLKGDIVQLGIEPIQMFGFGRGPQKNASDIQLVIDAVDIALTRPSIEIFVIVSGDGGFSALAKKLHEYGKLVIGCAFEKTTNKVFSNVCDDFIWLEEPHSEFNYSPYSQCDFTDPILIEFANKYSPIETDKDDYIIEARKILDFFSKCKKAESFLSGKGMNISIFSQALSYRIIDVNIFSLGFVRLPDFIRFATLDSSLKLVFRAPSEYRLVFSNSHINNFEDIPPLDALPEIHTADNYQQALVKFNPVFKVVSPEITKKLLLYICVKKLLFINVGYGDIVELLNTEFDIDPKEIRAVVISLISAGCFISEQENGELKEQIFSFIPTSIEQSIKLLQQGMEKKIIDIFGSVDKEIIDNFIN